MSIVKRFTAVMCSAACVLSLTFTHVAAVQTTITPVDGCGVSVVTSSDTTLVYGIPPRTSPFEAEHLFKGDVSFNSKSSVVASGDTLSVYVDGELVETAAVVISGDANCDGTVNGKDIIRITHYLNDASTLIDKYAADVDLDGDIDADDTYAITEKITADPIETVLLKSPDKTSYYVSQKFSCDGMILMQTYTNGDKYAVCDGFSVEYQNGDRITESDTYVTVSYGGFSTKIEISISTSNVYVLSEYVDEIITISDSGEYIFVDKSENTQIVVDADGCDVNLIFAEADMTYTGDGASVNLLAANSITLKTAEGTSYISDTHANTVGSAIYSEAPLTLTGDGILNVSGKSSEGITVSKASFLIDGGTYVINAEGNGIQPKGKGVKFTVNDGEFDIISGKDGIKNSKTDIVLNGGTFNIKAKGDGIQAENSLTISGGTYNIITSGGYQSDSGNSASSSWVYELLEEADMPTTEEEYHGLYVLSGTTYIEIDDTNYSTYSSYTSLYDRNSTKGIKAGTDMTISNADITLNCLDDGIKADGAFTLNSGTLNIKTACDGIQSDTVLTINDGTIDITGVGAFYQNNTSGKFKYTNGEYIRTSSDSGGIGNMRPGSSSSSSTLYALFNSGKGLKAETELYINGGDITVNGIDDNVHCDGFVHITNGSLDLTTSDDGIHAELSVTIGSLTDPYSAPDITVNNSYEGIEGIYIDINSGTCIIHSSDDGINAAGDLEASSAYYLKFNGTAKTYVYAEGDGLDANGYLYVYGGTVYVFGPTGGGNGIIDYDSSFEIQGGTFLAIGNKDMAQTATKAGQYIIGYTISSGSFDSGTYVNVSGADITVKLPKSYSSSLLVLVSSPAFSSGNTYKVSYGGSYTGGTVNNNVCEGGTYSGGTTGASVTTSSTLITSNGNMSSGGPNRPF